MASDKLPDTQGTRVDNRMIDKVGVRGLRMPFTILNNLKDRIPVPTVATFSAYCDLSGSKGIHMSRMSEILNDVVFNGHVMSVECIVTMANRVLDTQENATRAYVKAKFPLFVVKDAPSSHRPGYMDHDCEIEAIVSRDGLNRKVEVYQKISVGYTSLCACSKAISEASAHNQRSFATITVKVGDLARPVDFQTLISAVEANASSQLFSVLKREDEKVVTERAYANPKFVEDVGHGLKGTLNTLLDTNDITGYVAVVEHQESIHLFNACAIVRGGEWIQ